MEQPNNLLWKSTMTSGAFLGLAIVIYSIILVFIDFSKMGFLMISILGMVPFLIIIAGIIFGTKNYRDTVMNGHITYGNALMAGTLVVLFASIISGFYTYIYNGIIDPSYTEKTLKAVQEKTIQFMQEHGIPDDQIERQVNLMNSSPIPSALESALRSIPVYTILGFIFSLITSAFLKKEKSIFDEETPNTQQ